jgi:hypothetical protein
MRIKLTSVFVDDQEMAHCLGAVRLSLGQCPSLETRTSTGGY